MNEDTRTLNAFLLAVTQLQEPMPIEMVQQLHDIEKDLPESIYMLYELAEQFAPLHSAYVSALQAQPSEGEQLKAASTATLPIASNDLDQLLLQLRAQIAGLQIGQTIQTASSKQNLIQELGWTREQAAAIHYRLSAFREDWEAPGMEIYDDL